LERRRKHASCQPLARAVRRAPPPAKRATRAMRIALPDCPENASGARGYRPGSVTALAVLPIAFGLAVVVAVVVATLVVAVTLLVVAVLAGAADRARRAARQGADRCAGRRVAAADVVADDGAGHRAQTGAD